VHDSARDLKIQCGEDVGDAGNVVYGINTAVRVPAQTNERGQREFGKNDQNRAHGLGIGLGW